MQELYLHDQCFIFTPMIFSSGKSKTVVRAPGDCSLPVLPNRWAWDTRNKPHGFNCEQILSTPPPPVATVCAKR